MEGSREAPTTATAPGKNSGVSRVGRPRALREGRPAAPATLSLERDHFAALVGAANRTDAVGLLGAVALRAGVDRRARQAIMGTALVSARFGSLSFGYGHLRLPLSFYQSRMIAELGPKVKQAHCLHEVVSNFFRFLDWRYHLAFSGNCLFDRAVVTVATASCNRSE